MAKNRYFLPLKALHPKTIIDTYNAIKLTGITNTEMHTKGTVKLTIKNTPNTFHVIAEELPLAVNGILGIGFLQPQNYHSTTV